MTIRRCVRGAACALALFVAGSARADIHHEEGPLGALFEAYLGHVLETDPLALDKNPKALRRLADGTGGLAFEPANVSLVTRAFQSIAHDIRSRYTVAYAPPDTATQGHLRRVRVVIESPGRTGLKVRTRTGYISDSSPSISAGREVPR